MQQCVARKYGGVPGSLGVVSQAGGIYLPTVLHVLCCVRDVSLQSRQTSFQKDTVMLLLFQSISSCCDSSLFSFNPIQVSIGHLPQPWTSPNICATSFVRSIVPRANMAKAWRKNIFKSNCQIEKVFVDNWITVTGGRCLVSMERSVLHVGQSSQEPLSERLEESHPS